MNNPADNMYCMVSFQNKEPQILEIQGVVWFHLLTKMANHMVTTHKF